MSMKLLRGGQYHAEAKVKDDDKYVFFVIHMHAYTLMCLKWMGMEKANALEKYPAHCGEEESNGSGCVPLVSTSLCSSDFF